MTSPPQGLMQRLHRFAGQLRSSTLLVLVTSLFVLDLLIPDALPFVDEIVLGIMTLLVARWQSRRTASAPSPAPKPPPKDVTPPADS